MAAGQEPYKVNIDGSLFEWNLDEGAVYFENDEVVMLWLNTTLRTLIESIEEISGEKAAQLVMQVAGYRTGRIVSIHHLEKLGRLEDIIRKLPHIYLSTGWGNVEFLSFSPDERRATIRLSHSWEHKIQQDRGLGEVSFLPSHFAGVFTGLFGENIWYREILTPGDDPHIEYEFFQSDITPTLNIKARIMEQAEAAQKELDEKIAKRTSELSELIKEISSPIIPVMDSILIIPLIGTYDEARAEELINRTLLNLPDYKAEFLILDFTGIRNVDSYTLEFLRKFVQAASLLGTSSLFVGISPEMSIRIMQTGTALADIQCFTLLQQGITYALDKLSLEICAKRNRQNQ